MLADGARRQPELFGQVGCRAGELEQLEVRLQDSAFAASENGRMLQAQLATRSDRLSDAVRLWMEIARGTKQPEFAREAAAQLVRIAPLTEMQAALAVLEQRFGPLPPDLVAAYDVRRSEIEAALARKPELGL